MRAERRHGEAVDESSTAGHQIDEDLFTQSTKVPVYARQHGADLCQPVRISTFQVPGQTSCLLAAGKRASTDAFIARQE